VLLTRLTTVFAHLDRFVALVICQSWQNANISCCLSPSRCFQALSRWGNRNQAHDKTPPCRQFRAASSRAALQESCSPSRTTQRSRGSGRATLAPFADLRPWFDTSHESSRFTYKLGWRRSSSGCSGSGGRGSVATVMAGSIARAARADHQRRFVTRSSQFCQAAEIRTGRQSSVRPPRFATTVASSTGSTGLET
jgi:hypothetical protein